VTAPPSFTSAVDERLAALPPKTQGYAMLAGAVLGMTLYAAFGPNDIITALMVGAVMGGIAARLLIRIVFTGIEAAATRRVELGIVIAGIVVMLGLWYWSR
jgi:hypothetical protein